MLDFGVLAAQLKTKEVQMADMANAVMLTQEFMINNMFLPGQIENWVVIVNMAGQGLTDVPMSEIKGMAGILGSNYKSRMGRTWVINSSFAVSLIWKIIKKFIDAETAEKVHLTSNKTHPDLQEYFQPEHLKKMYGGQGVPTRNWPPEVPSAQNWKEGKTNIISEEEYLRTLEERPLLKRRPDLVPVLAAPEEIKEPEVVPNVQIQENSPFQCDDNGEMDVSELDGDDKHCNLSVPSFITPHQNQDQLMKQKEVA